LTTQLETVTLSDTQIATIIDFTKEVSEGLEIADQDFDARRQIIDLLDVRATLAIEEGQKIVYVHCMVGEEETLSIESSTSRTVKGLLFLRGVADSANCERLPTNVSGLTWAVGGRNG